MSPKLFLILATLTFLVSAQQQPSLGHLNKALLKNYSFVERSLDPTGLKIEESRGEILFNAAGFTVNISTPFKERYEVTQERVTILDIDLNQSRIINLEDVDSIFIKALLNGIDDQSPNYEVSLTQPNILTLRPIDNSSNIDFIFNKETLGAVRYKDNLQIEHSIELTEL